MKNLENKDDRSNSSSIITNPKEKSKGKEKIDSWIDDVIKQHKQRNLFEITQ